MSISSPQPAGAQPGKPALSGSSLLAHYLCQDPVFQGHLATFLNSDADIYMHEVDKLFDAYLYYADTQPDERESMKWTVVEFKSFLAGLSARAEEAKRQALANRNS